MKRCHPRLVCAVGAAWLALCSSHAHALPADLALHQMQHTGWTQREGAPPDASTLAQTVDGALWIGAPTGLYRFDGVWFEPYRAPAGSSINGDVSALAATDDGGLWIGMRFGDIYHLRDGTLRRYGREQGLHGRAVFQMTVGRDGTTWAATTGGLYKLNADQWELIAGENFGTTDEFMVDVEVDKQGRVWAAGLANTFMRPSGATRFDRIELPEAAWYIEQVPDGTLWFVGARTLSTVMADPASGARRGFVSPDPRFGRLLADRDGGLWLVQEGKVARVANSAALPRMHPTRFPEQQVQTFGLEQGLTGDMVRALYEDRAGNIWISTNGGIDQFRVPRLRTLGRLRTYDATWAQSPDGALFSAFYRTGLFRGDRNLGAPFNGSNLSALLAEPDGSMWVGTDSGLYLWNEKGVKTWPLPVPRADNVVQAIARDKNGRLWVSITRIGVFTQSGGEWKARGGVETLPEATAVSIVADDHGRVWLGYQDNQLAIVMGDEARMLGTADGFVIGATQAILPDGDQTWIGGSSGVARIVDGRALAVRAANGEPFEGVSGIVKANDGSLWLNSARGVMRVPPEELAALRGDANRAITFEVLGPDDGLRGIATQLRPLPSAFKEANGRLWFSTGRNVHWIDPASMLRSDRAPTVELRSVTSRGVEYPAAERIQLPRNTDQLDIDYAATDINAPGKVRFRYRLNGVDSAWHEAGGRRTAFYTNLSHGEYSFQVIAANGDGVWNTTGASVLIVIPPAFYQTGWFAALCVLATMFIAWELYRLRVRQLTARLRNRLEARLQERERIARELHDTLLQSTQGLIISLQGVARELPVADPTRERIERTLDRADEVLAEGRDRVHELRAVGTMGEDLPRALALAAEELQELRTIKIRSRVNGDSRKLRRRAREEAYRIAREALVNAFKHSEASIIDLSVDYEPEWLRVTVRDDGKGAPAEQLDQVEGNHWGVKGMRERTRELGARLEVRSTPGAGVTVELSIPASTAYSRPARRFLFWTLRGSQEPSDRG